MIGKSLESQIHAHKMILEQFLKYSINLDIGLTTKKTLRERLHVRELNQIAGEIEYHIQYSLERTKVE